MSKKMRNILTAIFGSAVYAVVAYVLAQTLIATGNYPIGSDTMFYVHRGEFMYESIMNDGNWYPLWDPAWYNGVETFRYWSPLSAYFLAGTQAIMGGDPFLGYVLSVCIICFLDSVVWLYLGIKFNRPAMGFFLGLIWFFFPNNLSLLFNSGVYARALSLFALPLFVAFVHDYLATSYWGNLPKIMLCFVFITMCHTGWAGMLAITLFVFLAIYVIFNRKQPHGKILHIIGACALSFLLCGLWVYASLHGGITSMDSSEIMKMYFQPLKQTIDFAYPGTLFYFGLCAFALAVFGSLFATRKVIPSFLTGIIVVLSTTSTAYAFLVVLPGSQYLWMGRFISIALTFLFVGFFFWRELRKGFLALCSALLAVEMVLSLSIVISPNTWATPDLRYEALKESSLIGAGQNITKQRLSTIEPFGGFGNSDEIYATTGYGNDAKLSSYGQGIQGAANSTNIVMINEAAEKGLYYYTFDRLLELGNDTVLIPVGAIENSGHYDEKKLNAAANAVGYKFVESRNGMSLYHNYSVKGTFGLKSTYSALGIGESVSTLAMNFPSVKECTENNLNEYTFEELTQYDTVFITDFTYSNKDEAQDLIRRVSEAGTRVVIMADGVPFEEETQSRTFLGLDCETISFRNGYPELETRIGTLSTDLFPDGYADWKTVYVNGLGDVWGTVETEGRTLDFLGTVDNDNIVVIGLGLTYFESLTQDPQVAELLSYAFKIDPTEVPEREIVPLEVTYEPREITISSPVDGVDTTLAYHDIFSSGQPIWEENNLLYVNRGETHVKLSYPYFWQGLAVSAVALVLSAVFLRETYRRRKTLSASALSGSPAEGESRAP